MFNDVPLIAFILFLSSLVVAIATISEKGRTFLSFIWSIIKKLYNKLPIVRRIKKLEKSIDEKLVKFSIIDEKLDVLIGEVKINGGSSLRDMITSLTLQGYIESQSRRRLLDASGLAFWESDRDGNYIYASEKLSDLVGLESKDILGEGWVTNLKTEDKERIFKEWTYAVKQRRKFIQTYTFVHQDSKEVKVQGHAQPIIHNNKIEGFVGILTEIK